MVHDSVLMAKVRVESQTRVVRSVLGHRVVVGAGTTLDGVVVGDDEVIEPGVTLLDVSIPEPV